MKKIMDREGRSRSSNKYNRDSRRKRSRSRKSRGRRSRSTMQKPEASRRRCGDQSRSQKRATDGSDDRSRVRGCSRNRDRSPRRRSSGESRSRGRDHYRSVRTPSLSRSCLESLSAFAARLGALEDQSRLTKPPELSNERATGQIVEAIHSLRSVSGHNYFISSFDPNLHDVEAWFKEVDKAKIANRWDDYECLSRIGNCLKGDAKVWLNEWVSNDRTWCNFKNDFKPLCAKKVDVANILYEVMSTDSNSFRTYADYARRSLLRLRIVRGLSDELITAIIIRGIRDPHVKASATNANLQPNDVVSFLSTFVKPIENSVTDARTQRDAAPRNEGSKGQGFKRRTPSIKCFVCGGTGHRQAGCPKKPKPNDNLEKTKCDPPSKLNGTLTCVYCKKTGHDVSKCFAKQRALERNQANVNFCSSPPTKRSDIVVGIIQGIPVDILIDSGAIGVSLISSSVVNHFSCPRKLTNCQIKGIGETVININVYVTLTIELEGISLEVDLLVVPDECMNAPVIIGTNVLDRDGVTYIRTKDSQRITREPVSEIVLSVESDKQCLLKTSLTETYLEQLHSVINEYSNFMISGTATTTVKTGSMHIRLNSDTPVYYRPYKMSHDEKLKVRAIIDDLLSKGIIRESESPYSSPILLVKKKDGSDRMCVDFRALNRITVKDRFPLPLIDDHIDRLGKSRYFTTLDMATGFHQIRLDEASIPLTGFVTPEGHFEYVKMPYGLANAPIVFQRIISQTLREFINAGKVLVYIDDCLILHSSVEEGLQTLREVLSTLTEAGFSINLRKCSFLCTEVEYLGRVVSNGEIRPSSSKVQALTNSPAPQNIKQVRQFLGLAGYFRRYIAGYSTKTACIAHLTRKDVEFRWGPEQEKVRQEIISYLTSEPVLAIFDPELPTEVHTDASSLGYGALLQQVHKDGTRRVVAYYSQVTKGAEGKYHSYELETLAVVRALRHFRHYLIGIEFTVVTDCNALKATQNKRDLLPRVARWWVYLQDFNFIISYRKGVLMPHADYFSRNPVNNIDRPRNWAQIAQAGDEETQTLMQSLDQGQSDSNRYVKRNNVLYYRYAPVGEDPRLLCFIPKGHRLSLLRIFHDEHSHINADKTLDLILRHFWFPGLRAFVKKYIAHCLTCIAHKRVPRAPLQPISSWNKPDVPFETVHADVLGPLPESKGFKHVMLVVDAFSKFCLLTPIYRQDLSELKRVLKNMISLFGTPKLIVCDRGRMFEASGFTTWMHVLGVQLHHITPEMHHANGQVERYVRTVLNMLRIEANHRKSEWADELWQLQLILNLTKQKTTQTSALNLLVGHENATPAIRALVRDVAQEASPLNRESRREIVRQRTAELLVQNQLHQDATVNENRHPPRVFHKDDIVFVIKFAQSKGKLDPGMRGPYRIVRAMTNDRYQLKLMAGSYGKTSYAAAQYLVPWRGEWTPESCAAFFEGEC